MDRHYLHVFPGFDPGGSQIRAVELMGMAGPGVRHSVIALNGRTGCIEMLPDGVKVEVLPTPPKLSFWKSGAHMAGVFGEQQPDLVLTYNWGSIESVLGARRAGLPVVHHEDGFGPEEAERQLRRRVWIRRWLFRSVEAVVVPSMVLQEIARTVWRQPESRVRYLPNGVDLARFRSGERSPPASGLVLGHVGRLQGEKGQRLLLQALARCETTISKLLIYGDGPDAEMLRGLAGELGIGDRVDFAGVVADTAPVYRKMDAFVLSSRTEQMPLTILEAMASGLPIVSTDVGDVRNMVAEPNRLLVTAPGDAVALAAAIDRLADVALRRKLGRANRSEAEDRFERGLCYGRYVDLYAEMADTGSA